MGSFTTQLKRQAETIKQKQNLAIRKVALELYRNVQSKTPVDSGQLRRSWTVALNGYPSNYNGDDQAIAQATFNDVIVIATNKPYAPVVEYGLYPNPPKTPTSKTANGYSIQAPKGMVRVSVQEIKAFLARNPNLGIS